MRLHVQRRAFLRSALAGPLLLGACSPFTLVNSVVPKSGYRANHNLAYGAHERQRLDVYQPEQLNPPAPVVVFFYGGNWNSGERGNYRFVAEALTSKGMVAVIPDYRLYPEVRFPDFLYDSAAAVRWTLERIGDFGGDISRVFLMGHSAGAYNAAMLAMNPEYLRKEKVEPKRVRGLIGLAGPYDFLPLTGRVTKAVFGFPGTPLTTQPIQFASADDPPALLITGANDTTVNPGNSARLAARLTAVGVRVRHLVYPDVSHAVLVGSLAAPLRRYSPALEDLTTFIADTRIA